jgi:hypothetical protein
VQQSTLWFDTLLDAVGAAVQAAGGVKKVASQLWPTLDSTSAAARLRGALNPEHQQKLGVEELSMVMDLAKDAGDHSIMEYLAREHGYDVKPLAPEEAKRQERRVRRLALLAELARLEDEE